MSIENRSHLLFAFYTIFISIFLVSCLPSQRLIGDYTINEWADLFEYRNYYKEGAVFAILSEGDQVYIPEGYNDLYCATRNDEGKEFPPGFEMCLVEYRTRDKTYQGWVLKKYLDKNSQ